jgi:7-keto-8-aminopelargonate synthetase-like enzyme
VGARAFGCPHDALSGGGNRKIACHTWVNVFRLRLRGPWLTMRRSPSGPKSKLNNGRTVTNLASYNFYNFAGNDHVKEMAIETLRTYGVGPCGPPQFYGTQDVHLKLEAGIASYLGMERSLVYSQAFSTISSVIPAFCKRGDIIVADKAVNFAIQKGLQICRSTIRWYEHNDLEDLERVLQKIVKENSRKPLTRRFIVTEGLSETVGDAVDLPRLVSF